MGRSENTGASKTLIVKNLSYSTTKSDVIDFFKQAGKINDVRFSRYFRGGACHIEFASEEGAKKAAELNGEYMLDRPLVLGFAPETIFVRGFNTSIRFNQVWSSLEELFSTCGKILWMHIPTFPDTDIPRGWAFIEFYDYRDYRKGLAMDGHKLGDYTLTVEDHTPPKLDLRPTGPRKRICGIRVGPYRGRFYTQPDRGWGGAGIGRDGSLYHTPQGKKIKFDDDSP